MRLGFWGWGPFVSEAAEGGAGLGQWGALGAWEGGCPGSTWPCQPGASRMVRLKLRAPLVSGSEVRGTRKGPGASGEAQRVRRAEGRAQKSGLRPQSTPSPQGLLRVLRRSYQRALSSPPRHWTLKSAESEAPRSPPGNFPGPGIPLPQQTLLKR